MSLPNHIFSHRTPYETFITISFRLRSATSWADASHEIAWWQHKLPSQTFSLSESTLPPCHKLHVQESKLAVQVSGSTWSLKFDRARGYLTNWVSGGLTLLQPDSNNGAAIIPSFWRAPTDNDVPAALPYWRRFGLDQMTSQLRSFTVCSDNKADLVEIKTQTYLSPPILAWGYNVQTTYTIFSNGSLNIKVRLQPTGSHPKTIPRVGLNMYLSQTLDQVSWFGPGPGESYPDKRSSQKVGIWSKAIPELQTNYEVPQENGNRIDTRWLNINNSRGVGIKVTGEIVRNTEQRVERTFQWQAGRHTAAAIEAARHPCDLTEEDATLLKLNAEVAGVGTAACGPGVREEFQVRCREVEFSFTLEKLEI
jgi:beta-galactosidase